MTDQAEPIEVTPRNIAKLAAMLTVQVETAALMRSVLANRTSIDANTTPVLVGSAVVGWYVSVKVKPVTDQVVDKAADFIVAKREARKARKSEKTENE